MRDVTITYLELRRGSEIPSGTGLPAGFTLRRTAMPQPELNRFLYTAVGGAWYWVDRLGWTYDEWAAALAVPGHETWVLQEGASVAGYFELQPAGDDADEIVYFGLTQQYIGRALGRPLLAAAIARAWERGAARLVVNTCTLDHAAAIANYRARGFTVLRTETIAKNLTVDPPGPW